MDQFCRFSRIALRVFEFRGKSVENELVCPMPTPRKVPKNCELLDSGAFRCRVYRNGKTITETFPLLEDTRDGQKAQFDSAEKWVSDTRWQLTQQVYIDTTPLRNMTVGDVLRSFRKSGLKGKPENRKKDENRIDDILTDTIASVPVLRLKNLIFKEYQDRLIARFHEDHDGEAPSRTTLSNKMGVLSRALKAARHIHEAIPAVKFPPLPEANPSRERRPTEEEINKIIEIGGQIEPVIPLAVRFAIITALRKDRILTFREQYLLGNGRGGFVIRYPKAKEREKKVGLPPLTRELKALIEEAKATLKVEEPTERLFNIGTPRFDNMWQETLKRAGIVDLHFHDLRHEATSRLFEKGLNTAEVMRITGHSTKEMVERYSHYSTDIILEKLDGIQDLPTLQRKLELAIDAFVATGGDIDVVQSLLAKLPSKPAGQSVQAEPVLEGA
jgi:integrase